MHPDQQYIDALVNNDTKLLKELYYKCFPVIRGMVLYKKGTEEKAADIFQEALIDLFRKAKTQEFVLTSSICSYLNGMCKYKWVDELKKEMREGVTFIDFERQDMGEDCFNLVEEHYTKQARFDLLKSKYKELGESCKELLRLSWSKNQNGKKMSTEEVATILKITNGYARKKKSECIVQLMKLVMNDPEFMHLK